MREVSSPVKPGDLVDGKYRVEAVLGVGGMGVVVRAVHQQLGRPVAIKLLLPEMLKSPAVVQRFEREARATARLKNEHIIDVLDVGRLPSGEPFIVMEFLEGSDLAKYLEQKKRLGVDEAIDVMLQICDGVSEAHAAGIVHRDLKPHNVFITPRRDGRMLVKVLDFGISKVAGDVSGSLTSTSDMLGSPYYMSPEQLLSTRDAGPAADVWALGIILYQLLAGDVPFDGETLAMITMRICNEVQRPITQIRHDAPPWLVALIEHCLQKNPQQRVQSVDALAQALRSRGAIATHVSGNSLAHAATAYTPQGGVPAVPAVGSAGGIPAHARRDSFPTSPVTNQGAPSMGGQPSFIPGVPPTIVQPSPTVLPGASTNAGWGQTSVPVNVPMQSGKGMFIGAAIAAVMLVIGGGLIVRHYALGSASESKTAATQTQAAPPPPIATTAAIPPAPAPTETAPPAPATIASATPPPSAAPATSAATVIATKPTIKAPTTPAHPPANGGNGGNTQPAKPPAGGDDLPSLRK